MLIDTHVHLNNERLNKDIQRHLQEAALVDVNKMICIGYDKLSSEQAIQIAEKYPNVYACIGIHPSDVQSASKNDLQYIEENINHPKVVGVGEIGLDYYRDKTYQDLQKEFFHLQLQIAKRHNKPVAIHSRSAIEDTYNILEQYKLPGVMHCFSSSKEMAVKFIEIGMYIGVGGVVTFHNGRILKEVVDAIDIENIVHETDAPFLAPMPYRGKTNKPKYIVEVYKKVAEIKGLTYSDVVEQVAHNVKTLFNI